MMEAETQNDSVCNFYSGRMNQTVAFLFKATNVDIYLHIWRWAHLCPQSDEVGIPCYRSVLNKIPQSYVAFHFKIIFGAAEKICYGQFC